MWGIDDRDKLLFFNLATQKLFFLFLKRMVLAVPLNLVERIAAIAETKLG